MHLSQEIMTGVILFILVVLFLPITEQLSCITNCPNIQVKRSHSFIEPMGHETCMQKNTTMTCKARIVAYYDDKAFPTYINYTLASIDDIEEPRIEIDTVESGLLVFKKFQFIVNVRNNETKIIGDIYCVTNDDCALAEVRSLFTHYKNRLNPMNELRPLIYAYPTPTKLTCYDSSSQQSKQCPTTDHHPVCVTYSKNLTQKCDSNLDVHVHYEFLIASPPNSEFNRQYELVQCNKDNCNEDHTLKQVEIIARNYAYGNKASNKPILSNSFLSILVYLILQFSV